MAIRIKEKISNYDKRKILIASFTSYKYLSFRIFHTRNMFKYKKYKNALMPYVSFSPVEATESNFLQVGLSKEIFELYDDFKNHCYKCEIYPDNP